MDKAYPSSAPVSCEAYLALIDYLKRAGSDLSLEEAVDMAIAQWLALGGEHHAPGQADLGSAARRGFQWTVFSSLMAAKRACRTGGKMTMPGWSAMY